MALRGIVCDGADAFDLDAQLHDIFLRAAFRQDSPASEEWPDAREILEALASDRGVDVHHRQLSLHEAGELYGMGERRLVRGGEISGMKNFVKWEHRCVDRLQLSVSQRPQPVNLSLVVRRGQGIERPLCLCVKDRLLVARDSQEGREGCDIFPLSAREVLLQVRFVILSQRQWPYAPGARGRLHSTRRGQKSCL